MPFTGALDSVLEQHRTAREGILEANMNPAAAVKALRAESAPTDSKHPKQRLHVRAVLPVALPLACASQEYGNVAVSCTCDGFVTDLVSMFTRACLQPRPNAAKVSLRAAA